MESTTSRQSVDLSAAPGRPGLALILALISVPGSMLTWDTLPGGGYLFGAPFAIAAIYLGAQAQRNPETSGGKAVAAIVIGAAMLVMMFAWGLVESL